MSTKSIKDVALDSAKFVKEQSVETGKSLLEECFPQNPTKEIYNTIYYIATTYIHIPYFPAFHRPGWLLRYLFGPFDFEWIDGLVADFMAGITVSLTLIPQALSYAQLANLPALNGLYCAILPSAVYTFFGSSLQLAVGPVALVSLMTGEIVVHYVPDYATNPQQAIACATQTALCVGIILTVMSVLNLGHFINFLAHPVMSGFTSGAACIIGLNQVKAAFGFSNSYPFGPNVPQQGNPGYEYNYQVMRWFKQNWYGEYTFPGVVKLSAKQKLYLNRKYRNFIATRICFGLYVPLLFFMLLKKNTETAERKKLWWYRAFQMFVNLLPFLAIIIGAHVAYVVKRDDHFQDIMKYYVHNFYAQRLKIVGRLTPGIRILAKPPLPFDMGPFFVKCISITLIAFMESYSVARRIAASRNELHILNASQEMWANGAANLLGSVSSAFPVSGSFSRSSLNASAGARTPVSKIVTMCIILISLSALTATFEYIPQAALAAVIFAAIYNLIEFHDLWEAWKHSKQDFFLMALTWSLVLAFNTSIALAVGIGLSMVLYLIDHRTNKATDPVLITVELPKGGRVELINVQADLSFINASRIKDFVVGLTLQNPPEAENSSMRIRNTISQTFDFVLTPFPVKTVDELPKAIVLDLTTVRTVDITGLMCLSEILSETRVKGILVVVTNVHPLLLPKLVKFGIKNNASTDEVDLSQYLAFAEGIPVIAAKEEKPAEDGFAGDVELAYTAVPVSGEEGKDGPEVPTAEPAKDDPAPTAEPVKKPLWKVF